MSGGSRNWGCAVGMGIGQVVVGLIVLAIGQHRLEQRQVDAYVRSKQAYDDALGSPARPAGEIERSYRRSQWVVTAIGLTSVVVGVGFCGAAMLSG